MKARTILAGSLLLNVLLLGALGGYALRHAFSPPHPPPPPSWRQWTEEGAKRLPPGLREKFLDAMSAAREHNKGLREEGKQARERALDALGAERFDAESYRSETDKAHALRAQAVRAFADAVGRLAESLSREERAALADMLRDRSAADRSLPPPPPRQ
jgi:uncharacterized membrane protein